MSRNKLLVIVTALSLSAAVYGCGEDDDSAGGQAGAAGSSGKGGSSGSAGRAGSAGTSGSAGADTGDSGAGGDLGLGGAGGDLGGAGAGAGGDLGGAGAGAGAGGEGGGLPVLTLTEACTTACDPAHTLSSCPTTVAVCITSCESYTALVADFVPEAPVAATLNEQYLAAISCMAHHLPNTIQYACATGPTVNLWSPVADTVCEDELCTWSCNEIDKTASSDETVYNRCDCP